MWKYILCGRGQGKAFLSKDNLIFSRNRETAPEEREWGGERERGERRREE